MSKRVRILLAVLVAVIVLYFVISQPEGAADVVRSIINLIEQALSSIATFFRSLF